MLPHLQLDLLRCPITGGELQWLPDDGLQQLREAVVGSKLVNHAGELVTDEPSAALVCHEARLLYLVVHGIPVLTPGEAIDAGQIIEE